MFEQALYEGVVSLLPECIIGVATVSDWGTFPLPSIVRQKAWKLASQAVLIGPAKWEQIKLPESTQCRTEAEVLVWTNSLCNSPMYRPKLMTKACECFPLTATGTLDQRISI